MKASQFKEYYTDKLHSFETYLASSLPKLAEYVAILEESMRYSLLAGGKRLRPVLLLTTIECGGQDPSIGLPVATAIEYIHTYSLIHDDLPCMDDDELRRGKPTNHIKFGEAIALLAGDALLTHSFNLIAAADPKLIAPEKSIKIIKLLSEKAGVFGMVSGQVADIDESAADIPADKLNYIHTHKTGALITSCVQAGAILAGFNQEEYEFLTGFGEFIGKCFQIQDDILDETGDKAKLGKTPGSDARNETLTYPKVYGLEKSIDLANESYQQALDCLDKINCDTERLRQLAAFVLKRDH